MRIWDLRAPGCQRAYESRAAVNTVVLHPNQGELISGKHAHLRDGAVCKRFITGLAWAAWGPQKG